jgi:hypothetical protein
MASFLLAKLSWRNKFSYEAVRAAERDIVEKF